MPFQRKCCVALSWVLLIMAAPILFLAKVGVGKADAASPTKTNLLLAGFGLLFLGAGALLVAPVWAGSLCSLLGFWLSNASEFWPLIGFSVGVALLLLACIGLRLLWKSFGSPVVPVLLGSWLLGAAMVCGSYGFLSSQFVADNALVMSLPDHQIVVAGPIGPMFAGQMHKALDEAGSGAVVLLYSGGGRVKQALKVAKAMRSAGVHTVVDEVCASACALLWAAGEQRSMAPGAVLGLHQVGLLHATGLKKMAHQALTETQNQVDGWLLSQGLPASVVVFNEQTPSDSMHWLTESSLRAAGMRLSPVPVGTPHFRMAPIVKADLKAAAKTDPLLRTVSLYNESSVRK